MPQTRQEYFFAQSAKWLPQISLQVNYTVLYVNLHHTQNIDTKAHYTCLIHKTSSFPRSCHTQAARQRSVAFRLDRMSRLISGGNWLRSENVDNALCLSGRGGED